LVFGWFTSLPRCAREDSDPFERYAVRDRSLEQRPLEPGGIETARGGPEPDSGKGERQVGGRDQIGEFGPMGGMERID